MSKLVINIQKESLENNYFRRVVTTSPNSQLVVMSLKPMEEIGMEVHVVDQFFRVEQGSGKAVLDGEEFVLENDFAVVIPAGTQHNIINTSATEEMKLYTIYSQAHHTDGMVHKTKEDAKADEAEEIN